LAFAVGRGQYNWQKAIKQRQISFDKKLQSKKMEHFKYVSIQLFQTSIDFYS
jgi:hypothetical protein